MATARKRIHGMEPSQLIVVIPLIRIIQPGSAIAGVRCKLLMIICRIGGVRAIAIFAIREVFPARLQPIFWRKQAPRKPDIGLRGRERI